MNRIKYGTLAAKWVACDGNKEKLVDVRESIFRPETVTA